MWDLLPGAFALMLVVEGLLPFISPTRWRKLFEQALQLNDGQVRFVGLSSMLVGALILLAWLG